jgi:DNA-binding NarL/FixJ family response regulator/signal transduction histidine kinase
VFDRQEVQRAVSEEVFRQMPAAMVIVEAPSGKILFVNRQAQQWTEEYIGQSIPSELGYLRDFQDVDENGISRIRHPDGRPYEMREWPLVRSITSGEEVRDWEHLYTLADGTHLWLRANSSPIYDEEGRIVAGVLLTHDITEQKRAEEALSESNRRIENILESFTDHFYALDHEGRYTYINERAVANVLAKAIERKETEERLEEVREAERSRIARDLHDQALQYLAHAKSLAHLARTNLGDPELAGWLSQLSASLGRVEQQVRAIIYDLRLEEEQDRTFSELLVSLIELHRTMAPNCDIRLDMGDGILSGPLGATGTELLRIVGEALTNARRHSGARNVRVAVGASEEKLWAEVSDDGRGFEPAEKPSTITGGMGTRDLRERAYALGGTLRIESQPGKGTKVRFELALERDGKVPEEEVRVLLVEDHAAVREAIASTLEREAGFRVVGQAGSLAEARSMLGTQPVDVAIIDLGLPDGYGADLVPELQEASPQAQALVLSAYLDRAQIARAVHNGAAGILDKTAHLDHVADSIKRLMRGETLLPPEEVVELLRFASTRREEEYDARQAIARLTSREMEVLQYLANGLDSEEIAQRLHISLRTERNHVSHILTKLGVHSQLQALVFAIKYGVVKIH